METQDRAKLSTRFLASLIDYAVIICFFMFFVYKYGEPNSDGGQSIHGLKTLVPFGFWFLYLIVVESILSATVGHFLLGLKIVNIDYSKIDLSKSIKRHILDPIDFFFFGLPAIISIKNTPLNQRLGDLWANTIVVIDKEKE